MNSYVVRIDFKNGPDNFYVYRNPVSLTEPGVPTLVKLGAADTSFDGISVSAFVGGGRTVAHDEVRFGESWEDVIYSPVSFSIYAAIPHGLTECLRRSLRALAEHYPNRERVSFLGFKSF